jgi:hypothetical protein
MPDDNENRQSHEEHARMFSAGTEEESRPEDRYEPITVNLAEEDDKTGKDGKTEAVAPRQQDRGIAELRAQLDQQMRATAEAQRVAVEASQRAQLAEQRVVGSTAHAIESAIAAADREAADYKAQFQAALDAADHKAAAEAQEKLSDARHNLLRLNEQKAYVEAEQRKQQQPRQQPQPQQRQQPNGIDSIAQSLVQDGYPRSADWLRAHPEMGRPDMLKRLASASNHLVDNKGLQLESDEYFAALEQELGMGQRQSSPRGDYRRAGPATSAAPTNGSVSLRTGHTQMRSHVPLTAEQRAAAIEMHGMTEKEYAREFEDARINGKLIGYR